MQNIRLTRRWPEEVEQALTELGQVHINETDEPLSREQLEVALANDEVVCPTVTDHLDAELLLHSNVRTKLLANFLYENKKTRQ